MNKRDYVRRRLKSDPADHHCHWPGCDKKCPPSCWGCLKHWRMLPKSLRDRIWAAFRPGQEETKTPSREYVTVAREVQEWIVANHPPIASDDNSDETII